MLFHADVRLDPDARLVLSSFGAATRSSLKSVNGLVIEARLSDIRLMAAEDGVQWLEPALPTFGPVNIGQ